MGKITSDLIKDVFGLITNNIDVDVLGVVDTQTASSILTFLDNGKYVRQINRNMAIKATFVKVDDADSLRSDIEKIVVDDPKWYFFSLMSEIAHRRKRHVTKISEAAIIHESAQIAEYGVVIADNVTIEPGVVVLPDVTIGAGATIRAGAVIGAEGFEHKRTSRGMLSVVHDGVVVIKCRAEIGPNNTVIKGFGYRPTIIGEDTKLDALVHYAHGVQSGARCLIAANAMLAGHVTLGNDVWIGPSASISNRIMVGDNAFVTLGAVVVKDVNAGETVSGNFAVPHRLFMKNMVKMTRGD